MTTTVINRAEILAGIALLPEGRRRQDLESSAASAFARLGAALALVDRCADEYAEIMERRRRDGHPIEQMDSLIASMCRVAQATLATRNTRDFEGIGLDLVSPWD